jgi:hypothetical protein
MEILTSALQALIIGMHLAYTNAISLPKYLRDPWRIEGDIARRKFAKNVSNANHVTAQSRENNSKEISIFLMLSDVSAERNGASERPCRVVERPKSTYTISSICT